MIEETIVTAAKAGERDVQEIPMAITAVSHADSAAWGRRRWKRPRRWHPLSRFRRTPAAASSRSGGLAPTCVFAGSDPSSAMYLDGVYLARPAMAFTQFLDLDRIEVLRGPQGTLYGRNAVGGAMNLIPRPPTNDLQASADVTAGNFGELRADARISGPLKRDRVMGSVAFARGVRDGYVRDLDHPDHPLGGDDVTAGRGQLRVVFNPRTGLLLSSRRRPPAWHTTDLQQGDRREAGIQFDNPSGFHDVRASLLAWNRTLQYGATARLTMALTPSTTLVSLTAFRTWTTSFSWTPTSPSST